MSMQSRVPLGPGKFHVVVLVINSFPRLSDFTDCGVKHSKYSIKLTT